ncbi:MAG TPA: outer membrane protein assembly factor BamA, partial [Desulforhopalus sp.]|nr:outer membrane protein assembly factor BamA [Desulforhopalus sp.]
IGEALSVDVKLFDLLSPDNPSFYFQTAESFTDLPATFTSIVSDIDGYLTRDFRIAAIVPEGNKRIDSGAILRKISTKAGDTYDQAALREDLKEIFAMGYFNDVQISVSDTEKGKMVVFRVIEKPIIRSVLFAGITELKEEDVREAANIKENFILNPVQISTAEEAIRQLYKTKGFYNSAVLSEISYPDDRGAVVSFTIDEGKKIFIKDISFEGNSSFDDSTLKKQIETAPKWFLSWLTGSGLLDRNVIEQDSQKIVAFYNDNGYLDAKIGEPQITQEEEWLYIKFIIEEGPRYRVGTVELSGDLLDSEAEMLAMLDIRNQTYLSRQTVRDDILKLNDYYAEAGYAFASIRPSIEKSPAGERMDVVFRINKGELVYIDRITIKGNTRTRDNVIRRELRVVEGGVFDSKALRESTQGLQRLMFFEEVSVTPEPSLDPNRMNIVVEVKEKATGTFSIGAGYSSVDNIILMGQISENNFLGRGDTLALSANIGGESSRYNLAYTNPSLNDSPLSWGTDLFNTYREYDDYTKESWGGGIRFGYPVFEQWRMFGNYSYTDTDLSDVSENASFIIKNSVDLNVTSSVKVSLVRDTRNQRYGASEGSRNLVSVQYAGGPLGGDAQFTKVEGSTGWYFPMPFKTVFRVSASAGQVFENESRKLPVYERFFLGGLNSVRGFEYGKISPTDPVTGERIGGDKMWYTNTEIIFPLLETQGLMGVIFYDAGQVLNDDQDWSEATDSTRQAAGVGVRWLSPMGPLHLVWGYNLDPEDDEDQSVWDFSVGGVF